MRLVWVDLGWIDVLSVPPLNLPAENALVEAQIRHIETLVQLDLLQNDLLRRLDDLDKRISGVLAECNAIRKTESPGDAPR